MHLRNLVDSKGRMNYDLLRDYVMQVSLSQFTEEAKHPFLVGKELYDGEIRRKIGSASSTSTMMFDASALRGYDSLKELRAKVRGETQLPAENEEGSSSISKAIYFVDKKRFSKEEQNIITIGRDSDNDIVIADYVISKFHAHIVIFNGMYFLTELGSTNGTKVNFNAVPPNMKVQLHYNCPIDFGRFSFIFTHPLQLYRGLRKEAMGI